MDGKYKWLSFLSTNNTLLINNEIEFEQFKTFLLKLDMIDILRGYMQYSDWQYIAKNNGYPINYIIFEYNNFKGLTFGYTIEKSKEWYEKEPLTVKDLELLNEKDKEKSYYDRGI